MTDRITIEPTAREGIRAAVRWKEQNGSSRIAARWYNGLLARIDTLRNLPHRCPVAAENDHFPVEIRELLHGRRRDLFRIIFTIQEDRVAILFVHHAARRELEP